MNRCAELIQQPGEQRDRLTSGVVVTGGDDPLAQIDRALALTVETEDIRKRLDKAGIPDADEARQKGILSDHEARLIKRLDEAVQSVIEVDDFTPEGLTAGGIPKEAIAGAAE